MHFTMADFEDWLVARQADKKAQGYAAPSLSAEIAALTARVEEIEREIATVSPYAALEDACVAYGRPTFGLLVGAGETKRAREAQLAIVKTWLTQARIMWGLVQAELAAREHDAAQSELNAALERLKEDSETDAWVRYQRGERPVLQSHDMHRYPSAAPPPPPQRPPAPERIAKHRRLEAELHAVRARCNVTYPAMIEAHPEYLEIIDEPKRAAILEKVFE